jgi:D-alanyl-D-alanine carboxypeptidase
MTKIVKSNNLFFICFLLLFLGFVFTSCKKDDNPASVSADNEMMISVFEKTADSLLSADKYSNLVFGVWMPDKNLVWIKNSAGPDSKASVSSSDLFCAAGIAKAFTATIIMQLVEKGKIRLADNLDSLLPKNVIDTLKSVNSDFTPEKINLKMLLNHYSGIPDFSEDSILTFNGFLAEPYRQWNPLEIAIAALRNKIMSSQLGEYHYSNTNYILLGLIAEKAAGMPFNLLLKEKVYMPSGIGNTFLSGYDNITGKMATGYFIGGEDVSSYNLSWAWACGGIITSVYDLYAYFHAYNNGLLLQNSTIQSMLSFNIYNPDSLMSAGIGLGFFYLSWKGIKAYGHSGAALGYSSVMYYVPQKNAYIIGYVNNYGSDLPFHLLLKIMERL